LRRGPANGIKKRKANAEYDCPEFDDATRLLKTQGVRDRAVSFKIRRHFSGTLSINGPRPTGSPPRMTMTARPLHRVVLGRVD
jgi:hypothetical protein